LLLQARRQEAEAEQKLVLLWEWLSLEEQGVGIVAEEGRTRSTKQEGVSIHHG